MWEKIQKFGPKYSDLPTMVSNINDLMRVLTLNIDSRNTTPIPKATYLMMVISVVCYYYGYQVSMVWFVINDNELAIKIVFGALAISSNIAILKLWYMLARGSKVRSLVNQCIESDAFTEPDTRFSRNMANILKTVKNRSIFFWVWINTIAVVYNNLPAFLPGRHLPADFLVFYGLEPSFETPNYEITFFVIYVGVHFICYTISVVYLFVIVIIGYIEAQMISLSEEILCVWDDAFSESIEFSVEYVLGTADHIFNNDDISKINLEVRKRLVQVMQRHSRIITLLKNANKFSNVPNAVAFACVGICLIASLLGGLEKTYLLVPFTFVQVAMDCFIGQKIINASVMFEKSVYECKWENFDNDNMKIVLLMLQYSQKTMTIPASSLVVLNYSCLMTIIRTVYSSYTTLRTTMNK